jgi:hypothetical protein
LRDIFAGVHSAGLGDAAPFGFMTMQGDWMMVVV